MNRYENVTRKNENILRIIATVAPLGKVTKKKSLNFGLEMDELHDMKNTPQ